MYSQEIINVGTDPNDRTGDPLRTAFEKVNNNFTSLFTTFVNSSIGYSYGNTPGQVIFEYPVSTFTQGQFYITSSDTTSGNSQSITLSAQVKSTYDQVKYTGYATTFFGDPVTQYSMDVLNGNVVITVNPLVNSQVTHLVGSQIIWNGPAFVGLNILADGYPDSVIETENLIDIITE